MSISSLAKSAVVIFSSLCVLQATPTHAGQAEARTNTSRMFNSHFNDARRFLAEGHWYDAIDKIEKVLESDKRTPDDTYVAYFYLMQANRELRNRTGMRTAVQGMVDSGFPTPELKAELLRLIAQIDSGERLW
jgi:Tfp pilus assembly protein PilF